MKCLKILIFAVVASLLLAISSTASATVLCKNNSNTTTCSEPYAVGTEIETKGTTVAKLQAEYKTIECSKTTGTGEITNAGGSGSAVIITGLSSSYEECNCVIVVLKVGELRLEHIEGSDNATAISSGEEPTTTCNTIFGNVHCIYVTNNDDAGKLIGGNPATASSNFSTPRLPTNGLCSAEAGFTEESEAVTPKPLYVSAG